MRFEITAPDGKVFDVEGPEGATAEQALAQVQAAYKPQQAAPSLMERGKSLLGGINEGIARFGGTLVDASENLVNLGLAGVGSAAVSAGKPHLAPKLISGTPGGTQSNLNVMRGLGIGTENLRPDDPTSRMLHTGGMIAGSSLLPLEKAPVLATTIPKQVTQAGQYISNMMKQAELPATFGALAGEFLGPEWVGVGALAPGAAGQVATSVNNAVASRVAPVVNTFKQAGTMPSVGQATDNVFLHGLENLAAKFPGGSGIMKSFIEQQQARMGATARTGVSTEAAGRAIEKGITGSGGFLDRTKAQWNQLDQAVAAKIPKGTGFQPANTLQALDDLTRPVVGAEKTTAALANPKLAEMKANLSADLQSNNGQVPFEALRALRSRVGSMLDDALVSGVPGGELKKVYGALSKDLETAATQAGAGKEFARQNNFYRARMDRIESVLDRVIGKGKQPEDIFKTVNPTDPDQANKVRAVMRSLNPGERQVVSEAVANRLGRAKPGAQNVEGEVFSSETFLTNWNKLSPGAKAQFFPEAPLRDNMDKLAQAAGNIRAGKGIYANPSGTAGSFAAYSVYMSPAVAIASGSPAPLIAGAGAAGAAYLGAKMLTSPKTVEWLARPINPAKPGEAAAHLARLGVIYNNTKDEALKGEIAQFLESAAK